MAAAPRTRSSSNHPLKVFLRWLEPYAKIAAYIIAILGVGFSAGIYVKNDELKTEKIIWEQDCNKRLQEAKEKRDNERFEKVNAAVDDLKNIIKHIDTTRYENKQ